MVSSTLAIKHTTHGPGVEGSNPAKSISFGVCNGRQNFVLFLIICKRYIPAQIIKQIAAHYEGVFVEHLLKLTN